MKVPLLDLNAHHAPIRAQVLAALEEVLDTQSFILGPKVEQFEKRVASFCGVEHAIGVSSGSDALLIALMGLDIGPGDEVITTPYSFFATAGAITRVGATPVFVDIDPQTYNIDTTGIESALSTRTKALLPVHLFGQCADMEPILAIAEANGLAVIEDAAQAIGAQYRDGRFAGTMGDIGCLSFFPTKNLGALGDGGMVFTNRPDLAEKLRTLRIHGAKPKYYHKFIGGNFRLDTLHASVLNVKLNSLDKWTSMRRHNARRYVELFTQENLIKSNDIVLPLSVYESPNISRAHIYNQFIIRAPRRDALQEVLTDAQIGTAVYYPVPFHLQECFAYLGYRNGDFPYAEAAAKDTLPLPIYPEVTQEQQGFVVETIRKFYQS